MKKPNKFEVNYQNNLRKKSDSSLLPIILIIICCLLVFFLIIEAYLVLSYRAITKPPPQPPKKDTMYSSNYKISLLPAVYQFPKTIAQIDGDVEILEDIEWLYDPPNGINPDTLWRYSTKGLFWLRRDKLYRKFENYNKTISYPPKSVIEEKDRFANKLRSIGRGNLAYIFEKTYADTLNRSTALLADGTTYIITGDIPLMWLRDSAAQVHHYLPLTRTDPEMQIIFEGLIRRQMKFIQLDPYASSYRLYLDFNNAGKTALTDWDIQSGRTIIVAMHNFEVDSVCYFVRLSYQYWKHSGISDLFDIEFLETIKTIIDLWETESNHNARSRYSYPELSNGGKGTPVCDCNLVWAGFRASDDKCRFHYNIPANMFVSINLQYLDEIISTHYFEESKLLNRVRILKEAIDNDLWEFGRHEHPSLGWIFNYEVDCCGNNLLLDDANVPSLLSTFYLGYQHPKDLDNQVLNNTIKFCLSLANSNYVTNTRGNGIGSQHTPRGYIWPMSLIMQAYTTDDPEEINKLIDYIESTAYGGTIHESFDPRRNNAYTREWFGWANSLFAELIMNKIDLIQPKQ